MNARPLAVLVLPMYLAAVCAWGQQPKILTVGGVPHADLERTFGCTAGVEGAGADNAAKMNAAFARAGAATDGIFDPYYLPGKAFAVSRTVSFPNRTGFKLSCNGAANRYSEAAAGENQGPASRLIWTGPTEIIAFDGTTTTATATGVTNIITLSGHDMTANDIGYLLKITGGNGFHSSPEHPVSHAHPNYLVVAADPVANTWTLGRDCTSGNASGLRGEASQAVLRIPSYGANIDGVLNIFGSWQAVAADPYLPRAAVGVRIVRSAVGVPSSKSRLAMTIANCETGVETRREGALGNSDNIHWEWLHLHSCGRGYWLRDDQQSVEHVFDYLLVHTDIVPPFRTDPIFEIGSFEAPRSVMGGGMVDVNFMQINGPSTIWKFNHAGGGNSDRFVIRNLRIDSSAFPELPEKPTTANRYTRLVEMTKADQPKIRMAGHLANGARDQREPPMILWGNRYDIESQLTNMPAFWQDALWDTKLGMPQRAAGYTFPTAGLVRHYNFLPASYRAGTIGVARGIVTLSGGNFPKWAAGGALTIAGSQYTVASRESDVHVTLDNTTINYQAGTAYSLDIEYGNDADVSFLPDRSPAGGGDLAAYGSHSLPRYFDDCMHRRPAGEFLSNDSLQGPNEGLKDINQLTVFVVFRPGNIANDRTLLGVWDSQNERAWRLELRGMFDYSVQALFDEGGEVSWQTRSGARRNRNGKLCLAIAEFDGRAAASGGTGVAAVQLDNEARDVRPVDIRSERRLFDSDAPLRVSGFGNGGSGTMQKPYQGVIAEVLIYDRVLGAEERNEIGGKLMARWGVPYLRVAEITGATNASPIVITSAGHGLANGQIVSITGVAGNPAANGMRKVTEATADTFALVDPATDRAIAGNGGYAGGGNWNREQ